jgi:hypothetical protein
MANTAPLEVIAAPFTVWIAPVGTEFPNVGVAPADPWVKIGTSGPLSYDSDDGVVVEHSQTVNKWRSLGDAGPRKQFRSEEDQLVRLTLVDVTLEQYRYAVNSNIVTSVPATTGEAGYKKMGLSRGFTVATMAVLVRGPISPYGEDDWNMQYEVPIASQNGSSQVKYEKANPAKLTLEWSTLVDPSAASEDERFGRLVEQTSDLGT